MLGKCDIAQAGERRELFAMVASRPWEIEELKAQMRVQVGGRCDVCGKCGVGHEV